jgi:hypothetical protein
MKMKKNRTYDDIGIINSKELIKLATEMSEEERKGNAAQDSTLAELDEDDLSDEAELSYEEGVEDGLKLDRELQPNITEVIVRKREDTRSTLAIIYVLSTFGVFILAMFIAVLDGLNREVSIIDNLIQVVPLISGVFLGTLGFVLGYYFRRSDEQDDRTS